MMDVFGVFVFLFGLIIGSFLNVVIFRYNTGLGLGGRSRCLSCGRHLGFFDLIPVFSFIFARGRCGTCRVPLSYQYPLVELITGILFYLVYSQFGLSVEGVIIALAFSLLIVITVYDIKHTIIPDGFVYAFIILSLGFLLYRSFLTGSLPLLECLSGPLLALPFTLLWFISKGRWMGFGDAKLALGMGWFLGMTGGVNAVILAFWIGAAVSIIFLCVQKTQDKRTQNSKKNFSLKSEIPFAPFLILGTVLVALWGITIIDIQSLLF